MGGFGIGQAHRGRGSGIGPVRKTPPAERVTPYARPMADVLRYRPGWRQLPWFAGLFPVLLVATHEGPFTLGYVLLVTALLAVTVAVCAATRTGSGVDLRPDALVVHGLRSRVVLWSSVSAVYASTLLGIRVVYVVVDGRTRMLRAPTHTPFLAPDKDFDAKVSTIVDYWVARRGPAWTPPAWVPELSVQRGTT